MPDLQKRFLGSPVVLQRRAEGQSPTIVGHASVFNEWTTLYKGRSFELREIIRPGAFRNAILEGQDVRALFDHDSAVVLGRTKSGTARISEDSRGLLTEIDPPNTQAARDVVELISRGDVSGMSFAFRTRDGGWKQTIREEGGVDIYETEITDVDLFDVSVVTYPAYEAADVSLRANQIEAAKRQALSAWLSGRREKMDRVLQSIEAK